MKRNKHKMSELMDNHRGSKKFDCYDELEIELADRLLKDNKNLRKKLRAMTATAKPTTIPVKKTCFECVHYLTCEKLKDISSETLGAETLQAINDHPVCDDFRSTNIQFPIEVKEIEFRESDSHNLNSIKTGRFVAIRPVNDEKTYLGLYLGELPYLPAAKYQSATGIMYFDIVPNPAIFVFDLGRVVFGAESWWSILESESDLREITDTDIENGWYVRALKALAEDTNRGEHID